MTYDAMEHAAAVIGANFESDFEALVVAKDAGAFGIDPSPRLYKRRDAAVIFGQDLYIPSIGLYPDTAFTQRASQGERRDNVSYLLADYVYRSSDPDRTAVAVELAAEALLRSIDRMRDETDTLVIGAGVPDQSVSINYARLSHVELDDVYEDYVTVRFPVIDRDLIS